jgi:hypothetical protein
MPTTESRIGLRVLASTLFAASIFIPSAVGQSRPRVDQSFNGAAADPPVTVRPLSREERFHWFVDSTVGPKSLGAGVISAAWGTAFNNPEEYGPHWDGFAKRYGMRLTGIAASNAIEAGLGSVWGEDPRYSAAGEGTIWARVGHAAKMTVLANRADGSVGPAYARYAGISGSNFLSNTWRVESDSTTGAAARRIGFGFAGKFVGNVFDEFWPDLRRKVFGRK